MYSWTIALTSGEFRVVICLNFGSMFCLVYRTLDSTCPYFNVVCLYSLPSIFATRTRVCACVYVCVKFFPFFSLVLDVSLFFWNLGISCVIVIVAGGLLRFQLELAQKMPGPPGDRFVEVMTPFLEKAKKSADKLIAR